MVTDCGADLDGVRAVGHDLGLDDRHQAVHLADGSVLREVIHGDVAKSEGIPLAGSICSTFLRRG